MKLGSERAGRRPRRGRSRVLSWSSFLLGLFALIVFTGLFIADLVVGETWTNVSLSALGMLSTAGITVVGWSLVRTLPKGRR